MFGIKITERPIFGYTILVSIGNVVFDTYVQYKEIRVAFNSCPTHRLVLTAMCHPKPPFRVQNRPLDSHPLVTPCIPE